MLVCASFIFVMCHCLRTTNDSKLSVLIYHEIMTLSTPKTVNSCESQAYFVIPCAFCVRAQENRCKHEFLDDLMKLSWEDARRPCTEPTMSHGTHNASWFSILKYENWNQEEKLAKWDSTRPFLSRGAHHESLKVLWGVGQYLIVVLGARVMGNFFVRTLWNRP